MANVTRLLKGLGISALRMAILLVIAIAVLRQFFYPIRFGSDLALAAIKHDRVDGARPFLPVRDRVLFNFYSGQIEKETGIQINMLFTELKPEQSIDQYAAEQASKRDIGRKNGARGVLIVYDDNSSRMRVEVGYGLEQYFSDAFVGRLIEDHASVFFRSGDVSVGLRLLMRIMHERIRDQMIGGAFDAAPFKTRAQRQFVSGGAGAAGRAHIGNEGAATIEHRMHELAGQQPMAAQKFVPQATAAAAYEKYVEWLKAGGSDPRVPLFTDASQKYLSGLLMTGPFFDWVLEGLWNEEYKVVERGDYAMMYYTSTPLRSPMFFRRTPAGWQVDFLQEIYSTQEFTGGAYTWSIINGGYPQSEFGDMFVRVGPVLRIKGGDNRALPILNRNAGYDTDHSE